MRQTIATLLRQTIAILLRKTIAILLRKTIATLLRKTIAILLRLTTTSNPFRGRILVQARAKHQARLNALPSAAESQQS